MLKSPENIAQGVCSGCQQGGRGDPYIQAIGFFSKVGFPDLNLLEFQEETSAHHDQKAIWEDGKSCISMQDLQSFQ